MSTTGTGLTTLHLRVILFEFAGIIFLCSMNVMIRECAMCSVKSSVFSTHSRGEDVKEYQELTPLSRICKCTAYTGVPYFQMGWQKIWEATLHQIFRVCRGHKGRQNCIILRGLTREFWGRKGEEKFLKPISPPLRVRERWNFSAWQRPTGPMSRQNIGP